MIPSGNFYKLLTEFEGLKTVAYQDSIGKWTIGIGTIKYPDGRSVKAGEVCTIIQANEWARYDAGKKAQTLSGLLINITVSQNQFDSLLSLCYNIGTGAFAASTLLKRIKSGTGDIREAFLMWDKIRIKGELVPNKGLHARREKEAALYLLK